MITFPGFTQDESEKVGPWVADLLTQFSSEIHFVVRSPVTLKCQMRAGSWLKDELFTKGEKFIPTGFIWVDRALNVCLAPSTRQLWTHAQMDVSSDDALSFDIGIGSETAGMEALIDTLLSRESKGKGPKAWKQVLLDKVEITRRSEAIRAMGQSEHYGTW